MRGDNLAMFLASNWRSGLVRVNLSLTFRSILHFFSYFVNEDCTMKSVRLYRASRVICMDFV